MGDQSISFQAMRAQDDQLVNIVQRTRRWRRCQAFSGGGGGTTTNTGRMFIALKPLNERKVNGRPDHHSAAAEARGGSRRDAVSCRPSQDLRIGGRQSAAQYQYTLQSDNLTELTHWAPIADEADAKMPELTDVNSDQQNHGLEANLVIDRQRHRGWASHRRLIDNILYDAFGERQVAKTYTADESIFRRDGSGSELLADSGRR